MAINSEEREFAAHVVDLMQGVGPVYSRRMFGGFGIFLEGLMFGLIANNTLYLKADDGNRSDFEELGLQAFTYNKQGKEMQLSYLQAPEEAMDHAETMAEWGSKGYGAAIRAAAKKAGKGKRSATPKAAM